jgi:hypothetical protein
MLQMAQEEYGARQWVEGWRRALEAYRGGESALWRGVVIRKTGEGRLLQVNAVWSSSSVPVVAR